MSTPKLPWSRRRLAWQVLLAILYWGAVVGLVRGAFALRGWGIIFGMILALFVLVLTVARTAFVVAELKNLRRQ